MQQATLELVESSNRGFGRSIEKLAARGNGLGRTVVAACCGSLLAGLLLLALLAWWDQHRQPQANRQPRETTPTGTAPPAPPRQPPLPPQTLQLRAVLLAGSKRSEDRPPRVLQHPEGIHHPADRLGPRGVQRPE